MWRILDFLHNSDEPSPWYALLTNIAGDLVKVITLGADWCKLLEKNWKTPSGSIFWSDFCHTRTTQNNSELLQLPLWFNSKISPVTLYLSTWQSKGITIIDDIINTEGFMKCEEIKIKYQLKRTEFEYYRV